MPVDTRAISQILQAYQDGLDQRLQREALTLKAKAQSEEMALAEQQRQDKVKQFDQRMKLEEQREKRILDMAKIASDLSRMNAKANIAQMIAEGKLPGKTSIPGSPVPQGLPDQFAIPASKEGIDFGGMQLSPEEYQLPAEYMSSSPVFQMQRETQKRQQQHALAMEQFRQTGRRELQEDQQAFQSNESKFDRELREKLAKSNQAAAMNRAIYSVGARIAANDNKDRDKAMVEIRSFRNSPIQRTMGELAGDVKIAKDYLRNPKGMLGINDIQLAYKFIRSQDPNAVKGDEMKLLRDNANPIWDRVGMKGRNFLANEQNMFTTEGRKKMLGIIIENNSSRFEQYKNLRGTIINNVKELSPKLATDEHIPDALGILNIEDVDDDTFKKIKERLNAQKNKK